MKERKGNYSENANIALERLKRLNININASKAEPEKVQIVMEASKPNREIFIVNK